MKSKEEIQLQLDWERYKNRLRDHWRQAAERYPCKGIGVQYAHHEQEVEKWYTDTYLSEPMSPGQEYAKNH